MIIQSLWAKQSAKFFCISTKEDDGSPKGKWKDNFFTKEEFGEIRQFLRDNADNDIYFCPHGFNRRARQKEEAIAPALCWADLDYADPRKMKPKPTIAFESSPGRFVGLWIIDKPVTESLNRRLTYHVDADHGGWDFTQVLRFPGTTNYKYDSRPRVRILWDDGPTYTFDKLDKMVPKEATPLEGEEGEELDPREVFDQHQKRIAPWARRELISGRPQPGKRSEMLWKLNHALLEAGLDSEEIYCLIKASPWNKFAGRSSEEKQLRREIDKVMSDHFNNFRKVEPKGHDKLQKRKLVEEEDEPEVDEDGKPKHKFLGKSMDEVEEEVLDWLWYPYLARGELSILEGDPGLGKSYMAQMIAGSIVDGRRLPTERPQMMKPVKGRIAYFDLENSAGSVTKVRLVSNGFTNLKDYRQEETPFSIDDDEVMDDVYDALEDFKPTLIVFDTLNTYLGKADSNNGKEVQQAMVMFKQLAKDFNCAVLVLRHLTKGGKGVAAIYRGQGSIAFTGMARVVMTCGRHPENRDITVMAVTKINVTKAPRAVCFQIQERPHEKSEFIWGDFVDLNSDEILEASKSVKDGKDKVVGNDIKVFLEEVLDAGPEEYSKIRRMADRRAISAKDLKEAAKAMGLDSIDILIRGKPVKHWGLPEDYARK